MNKSLKIITILTSIVIALFLLLSAVKITLNFRPLYYFDVNYLKISETTQMNKSEIIENYDVLIDYLSTFNDKPLEFPTLPMSEKGRIHFEDVKNIFIKIDYFLVVLLLLSIIGIFYLFKKKEYQFFQYSSFFLLGIPVLLFIPLLINFNAVFTLFHNITFRNDYWLFNPETDPIITLLPQRFFMHSALLILIIITIESFLLNFLYRYFLNKYINSTTS